MATSELDDEMFIVDEGRTSNEELEGVECRFDDAPAASEVVSKLAQSEDSECISCAEDAASAWFDCCLFDSSLALAESSQAMNPDRQNVSAAKASVFLGANVIFTYDPH